MTDLQVLLQFASLGIGGIIAGVVLIWKRQDDQRHDKYIETMNGQLLDVLQANTSALQSLEKTVEALSKYAELEKRIQSMLDEARRKS